MRRNIYTPFLVRGMTAALCLTACLAAPARAGFEWTPPPAPARVNPAADGPAVPAMPVPPVDAAVMGTPTPMIDAWPLEGAPYPESTLPAAHAAIPHGDYAMVEGFGSDIPLALVMQQIVPGEYAYSFDPGVDPGVTVSWTGGKPWTAALAEAVSPLGLDLAVIENTVWIRQGGSPLATLEQAETDAPYAAPTDESGMDMPWTADAGPGYLIPPPDAVTDGGPMQLIDTPSGDMLMDAEVPAAGMETGIAGHTPEQLAAIGMADSEGYEPSYPRRHPAEVMDEALDEEEAADEPGFFDSLWGGEDEDAPAAEEASVEEAVPAPAAETAMADLVPVDAQKVFDPLEVNYWKAEKGADLRQTLSEWGGKAGVELFWDVDQSYELSDAVAMRGTFAEAIKQVLTTYDGMAEARPLGRLYPNLPDGSSILVIAHHNQAATN